MAPRFWIETLGCPKNQVDSDKLGGTLLADGYEPASSPGEADLVVVNTCAFVADAREESIGTVRALDRHRRPGSRLVVTGCLAERDAASVVAQVPAVDAVAGFGVPVQLGPSRTGAAVPSVDLLNLPRPPASAPWAYVKVAEGCDRTCGFCAIPSFRGPQRSRTPASILAEVDALGVQEVVLVAQDLASYGRDDRGSGAGRRAAGQGDGAGSIVGLVEAVAARVPWVRLLYLYPSDLTDALVDAVLGTGVPYFDLSLQHASKPLLRRMRRWGDGERFLRRIEAIRAAAPHAAFRSNVIVGYPGETEEDHDALLDFLDAARLDWCGVFTYSEEPGTHAASQGPKVPAALAAERAAEVRERQDAITAAQRDALIGTVTTVLVDRPGVARSHREAPEIDGIVSVPGDLDPRTFHAVEVVDARGPDLVARPVGAGRARRAPAP